MATKTSKVEKSVAVEGTHLRDGGYHVIQEQATVRLSASLKGSEIMRRQSDIRLGKGRETRIHSCVAFFFQIKSLQNDGKVPPFPSGIIKAHR